MKPAAGNLLYVVVLFSFVLLMTLLDNVGGVTRTNLDGPEVHGCQVLHEAFPRVGAFSPPHQNTCDIKLVLGLSVCVESSTGIESYGNTCGSVVEVSTSSSTHSRLRAIQSIRVATSGGAIFVFKTVPREGKGLAGWWYNENDPDRLAYPTFTRY